MFSIRHLTASALVVALTAALVPFSAPASAAEVGIAAVGTADLRALSVIDANTIVAVGATGEIWRSTDGGGTWTKERNADTYSFVGVDFWNATSGVAVDASGKVASTTNGGDTWTNVNFGIYADMDQLGIYGHGKVAALPGATAAVAAAGDPNPNDDVNEGALPMRSVGDPGYWGNFAQLQQKPHTDDDGNGNTAPAGKSLLLDVDFVSSSVGIVSGIDYWTLDGVNPRKYPIYTTANSGSSWTPRSIGDGAAHHYRFNGVALGSATVGVTVGTLVADGTARAFRTVNSGANWSAGTLPVGFTASLNGVDMSSATQGWAVSELGTILRTTDGGANWTYCTVPPGTPALYDVEFIDGTTQGWAVGASGAALRTTDGVEWTALPGAPTNPGPEMGAITSATHPVEATWYQSNDPAFAWSATDADGVAGYSYILDQSPSTTPDTTLEPAGTSTSYTNQADGLWYFHIRAQDGATPGNWGAVTHRAVRIDTAGPTGTVSINGTAVTTNTRNVTLTLSATDANSGVYQMRVSEDNAFSGVVWETYATSKPFTLSTGDGTKTVYAQFRDNAGNTSNTYFDMIELDTSVPPEMGAITSATHPVEATWYANNDPAFAWSATDADGVAGYSLVLDTSASTVPDTTQDQTENTKTYTDQPDGLYYLHVRPVDTTGVWGNTVHRAVRIDTAGPTGTVSINGTALTTNTRNVTLTLTCTDANSGPYQMRVSEDSGFSGVAWESFATPKAFILSTGDGAKTVYAQFRDNAGNVSGIYLDTIQLDTSVPPTVTYIPLEGSDRYGTAVTVSQSTFPAGANAVIIATGLNFPDALASAGLAGVVDAPVLLVHGGERTLARDGLAVAEADRVLSGKNPKTVYVIGGPSAVSTGIESALKSRYGAGNVVRLGGADRYGTAYTVAARVKTEMASRAIPWTGDAFIVPGLDFRDALIVGPEAYAANRPIMLYDPRGTGGLTSYCASLGITRAQVSGAASGTGSVPTSLGLSGVTLSRIASAATPAARSVQVANWAASSLPGFGWGYVGIATADLYPDGLSAAPRMGSNAGPLLLTPSATLDATVRSALVTNDATITEVRFFGGPMAVTKAVRDAVNAALH